MRRMPHCGDIPYAQAAPPAFPPPSGIRAPLIQLRCACRNHPADCAQVAACAPVAECEAVASVRPLGYSYARAPDRAVH